MNTSLLLLASLLSFTPFCGAAIAGAPLALKPAETPKSVELIIHNSEDYIADGSDDSMDILQSFHDEVLAKDNVDISVTYSTFSTMEDELSALQTGGKRVDLVCVSDYIIQKLMTLNMIVPFAKGEARTALYGATASDWPDNYTLYASQYLQKKLSGIKAKINGEYGNLGDYARGYMWGTLGITYNPGFSDYKSRGLSEQDVMVQMSDWNALWASQYAQTFQIKDSMRDTYSVGLMHVYDSYFKTLASWYQAGKDGDGNAYDADAYNTDVSTIFNNINHLSDFNALVQKIAPGSAAITSEEIVDKIQAALISLKAESFGLEVDSGKTDIVDGTKSGIDTAWSGDAIVSMNGGDELSTPNTLYYSIPKTGGNIWFDAWVLMKGDSLQQEYAQKFIDFISRPDIASANMDYIGYTSFIGGDAIVDWVRDNYDVRTMAMYAYLPDEGAYYYDDNGDYVYRDGTGIRDVTVKDADGNDKTVRVDFGLFDMTGSTYDDVVVGGDPAVTTWRDYAEKYLLGDENPWVEVDLSYFFEGSSENYTSKDFSFWSDEFVSATGKNLAGEEETVLVGRQFLAQYPTEDQAEKGSVLDQIPGLAVMEDYGENNSYILFIWENVKSSGAIQPWIIILLSIEVAAALSVGLYFFFKARASKILRKKRREDAEK
jgi:spermidine/putrescine transport system substrate-binding protein